MIKWKEKIEAYEMALPKGRIVLLGELSKGDVAFIRKWLNRIETAQQTLTQSIDNPANEKEEVLNDRHS